MNVARQELPGKRGNRFRVPEGRLKILLHMHQSSLRDWTMPFPHPRQCLPG